MDVFEPEKRRWLMQRIKTKDTKPERIVRSMLHALGFRFRLCRKDLPGKPDIVLPKHRSVVFVHGCFWHQHPGCPAASRPATNTEFWNEKLDANVVRDATKEQQLRDLGWRVLVVWGCQAKKPELLREILEAFLPSAA